MASADPIAVMPAPAAAAPMPTELDGIPVGYIPGRVCYIPVPDFGGTFYHLHDPERPDCIGDQP